MELKAGYKRTEVGVIPAEWEVKEFASVATLERGKFTARPRNDPRYYGGDIPFIQTGDVSNSNGEITAYSQTLNLEGLKVSKLFPRDTLFFTIAANIGDIGFAAFDTACPDSLVAVTPIGRINKRWLSHELRGRKKSFESLATHNAQLNINLEKLRPYLLPIPPVPEQDAIAAALGDVDALIGGLDQLIAKKRDLKQATMQQFLTGKQRLPGFRGDWEAKRFEEVAALRTERVDPRKLGTQQFCVELEHIESRSGRLAGSGSTSEDSSLKSVFQAGDVLFGKLRSYLRKYWLADRPGVCSTEIWVLVANRGCMLPEFLFQLVTLDDFIEAASTAYGTHMPRSDWNVVKNYQVTLPKPPEQTAIAAVLSDMDAEISALEQRRDKTRALKQGMMQELLTGRTRLV